MTGPQKICLKTCFRFIQFHRALRKKKRGLELVLSRKIFPIKLFTIWLSFAMKVNVRLKIFVKVYTLTHLMTSICVFISVAFLYLSISKGQYGKKK